MAEVAVRAAAAGRLAAASGDDEIDRFTWGFNVSLPGGSLLFLNHEHWIQPDASDIDVVGVRWTETF